MKSAQLFLRLLSITLLLVVGSIKVKSQDSEKDKNASKIQKKLLDIELVKLREQLRTELLLSGGNTWDGVNTIWINLTAMNHLAFNIKIINKLFLFSISIKPQKY